MGNGCKAQCKGMKTKKKGVVEERQSLERGILMAGTIAKLQ